MKDVLIALGLLLFIGFFAYAIIYNSGATIRNCFGNKKMKGCASTPYIIS
jgi:hypothetical protein